MALLLSVVLTMGSLVVAYATQTANPTTEIPDQIEYTDSLGDKLVYDFKTVASNDRFELDFDHDSTFFRIVDKVTGQAWYSNPPISMGEDPYVAGTATTSMRSSFYLAYTNASLKEDETNAYAASVNKGTYDVKEVENGIRVDYRLEDLKMVIPVQYTLNDEGFRAELLLSEIQENGSNKINRLRFLQHFGTAGAEDEGYLVLPDGSGAIVEFNNQKTADGVKYNKDIYGNDASKVTESEQYTSREENITLPVYGMVKNGYGFLAEVVTGAEIAELNAVAAGNAYAGAYTTVCTTATYRINYKVPLMGQITSDVSDAMFNAQNPTSCETYAVEYRFSDSAETSYTTLATMYREALLERGWLTKDAVSDKLYTQFYGGVSKTKSFLGIVYEARETLTSFEDAEDILEDLKEGGVTNISTQYVNYADDFFNRDMEIALKPSGSLGGADDMESLMEYASEGGIVLAPSADFVTMPSGGNGYSTFFDVADAINVEAIKVFPYSLSSNTFDTTKKPYYLVDPKKYDDAIDSLIEAAEKYGYTAYYFDEEALQLYSDLAPEGAQAEVTSANQAAAMAQLVEAGMTLTMANPNAYLFRYAAEMVEIPVCSSKELLFDMDIPFLQIVLRGMKNFGGESMNITDVSDEAFLRHLEYGTDMRYSLIEADSESLLNTDHTFLYSATYSNFADQIKERYAAFEALGEAVEDANIVDHTRVDNVAVTTYSNGAKVIVNYNAEAVTIDGTTVDGMSYAIV